MCWKKKNEKKPTHAGLKIKCPGCGPVARRRPGITPPTPNHIPGHLFIPPKGVNIMNQINFLLKPQIAVKEALTSAVKVHFNHPTMATYSNVRHNVIVARQLSAITTDVADNVMNLCFKGLNLPEPQVKVLRQKRGAV